MSGETTYLFFDFPLTGKVPGFHSGDSFSMFPFWGQYRAIDFAFSNFSDGLNPPKNGIWSYVISHRNNHTALLDYSDVRNGSYSVIDDDIDKKEFLTFLRGLKTDRIVCYSVSSVFLAPPLSFNALADLCGKNEMIKIAVENTPQDIFFCDRKYLISRIEKTFSYRSSGFSLEAVFQDVLDISFSSMEETEGLGLFRGSLFELYSANQILRDIQGIGIPEFFQYFSEKQKDSAISEKGKVINSLIAPGVRIEGAVKNSLIFEDVHIRSGAEIIDSVIMPGNHIGRGVRIENTLLFPNSGDTGVQPNIGEDAVIGGSSKAVNRTYPDHIFDGLSVLGFNAEIPSKHVIEPAAFIDSYLPKKALKALGTIKRGWAVEEELARR